MGVYAFMPLLIDANGDVVLGGMSEGVGTVIFILNCLVAVLALVTIFKFKASRLQMTLCIVGIVLIVASLATLCCVALTEPDCDLLGSITYFNVMPIVAIVLLLLAHRGINHDRKLLRDSARIR